MNEWDMYTTFATDYHWTPEQVDALDPDFLDSLLARRQAQAMVESKKKPTPVGSNEDA